MRPDAVVGHSVGEVAAAQVGGALSLVQAIEVVVNRGRLMQRVSGKGMMAAVAATGAEAQELIRGYGDCISIAAVNGPQAVTLSGDRDALQELLKTLNAAERFHKVLPVDCAFHSAHMTPYQAELTAILSGLTPQAARLPIFSTVTGGRTEGRSFDAAYWGRNIREPVAFAPTIEAMADWGCEIFLEIGPHPVLLPFVAQILDARGQHGLMVPSLRRGRPERETLLDSVAALYAHGCEIQWNALLTERGRCVSLPTYPWQRERFWVKASPKAIAAAQPATAGAAPWHPLLGARIRSPLINGLAYQATIGPCDPGFLSDHRIVGRCVVPATAMLEMAMAAALEAFRSGELEPAGKGGLPLPLTVTDFSIHDALFLNDDEMTDLQFGLLPESGSAAAFQLFSASREPDRWTIHARGAIRCGLPADDTAGAWPASLAAARKACTTKRDVDRHYTDFIARGLDFGPAFRGIDELWVGENAALAYIAPPAALAADRGGYLIHPAFLDACFQVLGALLPTPAAGDNSAPVYLPIALAHLQLFKIPEGPVWSFGRLGRGRGDQAGQLDGEIVIFDGNGALIAQLTGLRLMATPHERMLAAHRQPEDDFLYEIAWQPKPAEAQESENGARHAIWIVFGSETGVGGHLPKLLAEKGERCVMVSGGERFARRDAAHYQLDPMEPADFRRLIDSVAPAAEAAAELRLVHLSALDSARPDSRDRSAGLGDAAHILRRRPAPGSSPRRCWHAAALATLAGDVRIALRSRRD